MIKLLSLSLTKKLLPCSKSFIIANSAIYKFCESKSSKYIYEDYLSPHIVNILKGL